MTAVALAAGIAACAAAPACAGDAVRIAQAQPPGSIPGQDPDQPDDATDAAAVMVRVGRLENQIRTLTGQIEQLQHQNQTLQDSLRKLAQDVDFRFQDLQNKPGGAAPARPAPALKRGDAGDDTGVSVATGDGATPGVSVAETPLRTARAGGDAFNPASDPGAPGAPRPLGTTPPSQPLPAARTSQATGNAPLDLMQRPGARTADTTADPDPAVIAAPPAARNPDAVASLVPGGTREEYESDLGLFRQGQYDGAATALQSFVDKYPKDRLVPDAVFMLGESYSRLGRQREAAEQFPETVDRLREIGPRPGRPAAARHVAQRARGEGAGLRHLPGGDPKISGRLDRSAGRGRPRTQAGALQGRRLTPRTASLRNRRRR